MVPNRQQKAYCSSYWSSTTSQPGEGEEERKREREKEKKRKRKRKRKRKKKRKRKRERERDKEESEKEKEKENKNKNKKQKKNKRKFLTNISQTKKYLSIYLSIIYRYKTGVFLTKWKDDCLCLL